MPHLLRPIAASSIALGLVAACDRAGTPPPPLPTSGASAVAAEAREPPARPPSTPLAESAPQASPPAASAPEAPAPARYPWLADGSLDVPSVSSSLEARFDPPAGFRRVALAPDSFGAFLRTLPLASPDTPVLSHDGRVLRRVGHPNVAAVAAIDVGRGDLQQCADSVIRLHAEWLWSRGRRDMSYRAAAGSQMPFSRWARGERPVAEGNSLSWVTSGSREDSHASFRKYLDSVFMFANTVSLSVQAAKIEVADLRPGDFVVAPGNPGHAVLVLDLARAEDGRRTALLGQGFMPAQSFHVLRVSPEVTWFPIDPRAPSLETPFWDPFPWAALRRLDAEVAPPAAGGGVDRRPTR